LPALPVPGLPEGAGCEALVVETARMDRSGRVYARHVLGALGWGPGHRVDVAVVGGVLLVGSVATGLHVVGSRGELGLPAAARRMCGITPGLPVLLAASLSYGGVDGPPDGCSGAAVWPTGTRPSWRAAMVADPARVAAARRLLARLGVTLADLQDNPDAPQVPTVAEYLPQVLAAAGPGARRTYGSYWARMTAVWGTRRLDEIAASDIEALQRETVAAAR